MRNHIKNDERRFKMNKSLMLVSLVFGVMLLSMVSAGATVCLPETEQTIVDGTIYQNVITNVIAGADVTVVCHHGAVDNTLLATSLADGSYSVNFGGSQCSYGDEVTVSAVKASLAGTNEGTVNMKYTLPCCGIKLNVGVVNVPMVPEFGVFAGALTLLSAVGIFFMVRRK
jgi:hypothetical protein